MESFPDSRNERAFDEKWYSRLEELYFEDYTKLEGDKSIRQIEKTSFLNRVSDNPDLDYPDLFTFDFDGREQALVTLKNEVLEQELNPFVKKIYRTKINELLATLRMLKASRDGDDGRFSRYAKFIYGSPSDENVSYVLQSVNDSMQKAINQNGSEIKTEASRNILNLISAVSLDKGDKQTDKIVFPKGLQITGSVESSQEAVSIFSEALVELGIDDWQIVVDKQSRLSTFSADQENKTIRVPSDEKLAERKISKKKLSGLVEHEIKTHALRRYNGERSKLHLLGLGLDRYIKGEEGVATYNEQQVTGANDFAGIPRYFAIAVAKGFDGEPRDFRQTFEVMMNYYLATLKDYDDLVERAENSAWTTCVRIFRGTTAKTPGAVYSKDLAYFEGNKDIWHLVSKDSDVVQTFSIGKFDSTNDEHVYLLSQLGILDSDLEVLDGSKE